MSKTDFLRFYILYLKERDKQLSETHKIKNLKINQ